MTDRIREVGGRSLLFFFKGGLISCLPGKQWASRPREMKNESFITSLRNGKMGIWWMPPYGFAKNETARISAKEHNPSTTTFHCISWETSSGVCVTTFPRFPNLFIQHICCSYFFISGNFCFSFVFGYGYVC